jgi:non-ribosomal peptide synthetase component E (peptide arylation enzyme)
LKHYDYWIRPRLSYPTRPLHEILSTTATEMPDAPATAFLGATLSFGEIKRRADRLSAALLRLGIAKGDRVGIAAELPAHHCHVRDVAARCRGRQRQSGLHAARIPEHRE